MASDLPERLRWTLDWQTRKLMPLLGLPGAEARLLDYWLQARRMREVLQQLELSATSLSVDVGGGLTTPLRWLPGRRICVDPLAEQYATRFPLPLAEVTYAAISGETLPFVSGSCDLVICTNCIDHTADPHAVLREIDRILRPGGWLWLTCEENPPDKPRNAGHPHALDRGAIARLMAPFDVVQQWEEPWRGVYGHLLDRPPHPVMELGFLARKAVDVEAA